MENILTNESINLITRDLVRVRNNLTHLSYKDITFVVAGEVINGENHSAYSLNEFISYCYHVLGMGIDDGPLVEEARESVAELILKGIIKPDINPFGIITYKLIMSKEEAIELAQKISLDEGCVQHVNVVYRRGTDDPTYYVSDWYNCDSTVASFENGNEL